MSHYLSSVQHNCNKHSYDQMSPARTDIHPWIKPGIPFFSLLWREFSNMDLTYWILLVLSCKWKNTFFSYCKSFVVYSVWRSWNNSWYFNRLHSIWHTTSEATYLITVEEHQEFLTKTEISLISDKSFTMKVYGNFRFWMVQPPLGTLQQ